MERMTMTAIEVARLLGVSKDLVYEMARKGQIPHIRVRRRLLFRRESIEQWIEAQERKSVENVSSQRI